LLHLVGALCLTVLVLLAALLAVPVVLTLFGYRAYVVYGGSMGLALPAGSVGIVESVDSDSLQVGDIIAAERQGGDSPILHRIVDIDTTGGATSVITQGDNNSHPDSEPVVLGRRGDKVAFSIPYLGYLVHFARGALGRVLLIALPSLLLLALAAWRLRRRPAPVTESDVFHHAEPIGLEEWEDEVSFNVPRRGRSGQFPRGTLGGALLILFPSLLMLGGTVWRLRRRAAPVVLGEER
jgi:signal peptidase